LRRTGEESAKRINESRFTPYVEALRYEPLTGTQLAEKLGRRNETVSRVLAELREFGLSDYRRDGTAFVNFLTPLAYSLLGIDPVRRGGKGKMGQALQAKDRLRAELTAEMQSLPLLKRAA
jgi:transcription initiation factor IIE alpha subunit